MTLPEELLEVLACPRCHGPLGPSEDARALDCVRDGLRFRIVDGIPVLLLEEATPIDDRA